jgi:hypothetical protein
MPPRNKIATLPKAVKACLDTALAEQLQRLRSPGQRVAAQFFSVSKSTLHRYGQDFESKLSALKVASEQARAVVVAAPDEEGAVNKTLMCMIQEHLFNLSITKDKPFDLAKVAKDVAELGEASVTRNKWQTEYREKAEAAASRVEKIAKRVA